LVDAIMLQELPPDQPVHTEDAQFTAGLLWLRLATLGK
jgi:hypothetical protein